MAEKQPPSRIKLTPEAAKYIRTAAGWLEKARCRGDGPPFVRMGARKVGYFTADLDAWLEARRRTNTSDAKKRVAR